METVVLRFWRTHSRAVETTVRFAEAMLERGWYPECFNGSELFRLTLVTCTLPYGVSTESELTLRNMRKVELNVDD